MTNYLEELNESQRDAVLYNEGPSLVIAGAGSGKTRVLTYKIAYLLEQGYTPWSILALTFTNKAAREMKERIARQVGDQARYLWMGTFHSIFSRILRCEAQADALFAELGMNLSTAFNIFVRQSLREGGIPFEVKLEQPNKETIAAMLEAERIAKDPSVKGYNDLDELFADLKK